MVWKSVKDLKASELSQEKWNIKKLKDDREGEAFLGLNVWSSIKQTCIF